MSTPRSRLDPVGLLAEEFLARYRRGERPCPEEYVAGHPDLAEEIRDLFPALLLMEELGSADARWPGGSVGKAAGTGTLPDRLGDYRILRRVGRGGMGVVYEAVQESLGRHVALKVLPYHGLMSPTPLERFRREARAAARLHHPNIVPVHGVGEHEGVSYYAMQFIQGQGLDEVLMEVRRLRGRLAPESAAEPSLFTCADVGHAEGALDTPGPPRSSPDGPARSSALSVQDGADYYRSVARIGIQVAEGLDYAHKQGIVHRDIKPSNLLLDARGTVWITDFGLAKAEDADELTQPGDIVGTLRYMAPERFRGWSDPRSDVYALGITLYELLSLRPAFADSHRTRLMERITHEVPPAPRKMERSIPRDLETIVLKAIDKEPGRRYQTAAALAQDLERFVAGRPVHARRHGLWGSGFKWVKRRPASAALLLVSTAAVIALIVGTIAHNARLEAALRETRSSLMRARLAEEQARLAGREMARQSAIAYLREAQALRNSGQLGRRFEGLETIKKAVTQFRVLGELDEARTLELRNEAIACLTLADLKPGAPRAAHPGWSQPLRFDPSLQYFVVSRTSGPGPRDEVSWRGELCVRRVVDDREIALPRGFGVAAVLSEFSPDGRYLAVHYHGKERHNYVWDLGRREPILKVSQGGFDSFPAFSPESRRVALARPDGSIPIYELPSGMVQKVLPPGPPPMKLRFHPDGRRLTIVGGKTVHLHDVDTGNPLARFAHPGPVACTAWRGDGRVLATGGYENDIYLWDAAKSDRPLRVLKGHHGAVVSLGFSRAGDLLLSSSWDSTDRLWDPATGQQLVSMPGSHDCQFGPGDCQLDHGWQVATGRECRTFHDVERPHAVAMSPRYRLMASAGAGGVRLWDPEAESEGDKELGTLPVGPSKQVRFDPRGDSLITDGNDGLQRWPITPDPQTGGLRIGPPRTLGLPEMANYGPSGYDSDFALSADGGTLVHNFQWGVALIFEDKDPLRGILVESHLLRFPALSPDRRWLATGNWQGRRLKVWDAATGMLVRVFDPEAPEDKTAWPAFSPDGRWLVTGTYSEYRFWEVGSWRSTHAFHRQNAVKTRGWIVFSPDSRMVALLENVRDVSLVDPATGRRFARLPTAGWPYCFSPDGTRLVTYGGSGGSIHVWDLRMLRRQLQEIHLDWDSPAYPLETETKRLRIEVVGHPEVEASAKVDARGHLDRGLLYVRVRRYPSAWADFDRAVALDPRLPVWTGVIGACSRLVEANPWDLDAVHWRAHAHEKLGEWEDAIHDYCRVLRQGPQRIDLIPCRRRAYLHCGEQDRAEEDFRAASRLPAQQQNELAWMLVSAPDTVHREPALAVALAKQAVRQTPAQAAYWNTLGVAHFRAGEWDAAVEALEEAEKRKPGESLGFNAYFLAMCHHVLGDSARARANYDRAVRWSHDHHDRLPESQRRELLNFEAEAKALLRSSKD